MKIKLTLLSCCLVLSNIYSIANAAVALDRTRAVFDGANKSISMTVKNNNDTLPYLAQGWIEDSSGKKITSPLIVLPPVQRLEPGKSSQIKVEALPAIKNLPQDRESLFYFNLREIPPKSDKPNTLQIALQTKIKLFYRPESITPSGQSEPWQEKMVLELRNGQVFAKNPTAYFIVITNVNSDDKTNIQSFKPIMVAPFSQEDLGITSAQLGSKPILTYVNDYGGRPNLFFNCQNSTCNTVDKPTK